jgi:di/tricarboxylate transporter
MSTFHDDATVVLDPYDQQVIVGISIAVIFLAMAFEVVEPEIAFLIGLVVMMLTGILTLKQCLAGFANESMLTIGALFLVIGAVEKSHIVDWAARKAFGAKSSRLTGSARMLFSLAGLSAFFNNTPLVAIMIPVVRDWARGKDIPLSFLLIPLSYGVLAGGMITMIGTSTSLTVQGLMLEDRGYEFNFFAPAPIALPCVFLVIMYMIFAAPYMLPNHSGLIREFRDKSGDMIAEISVGKESQFVGKKISQFCGAFGISQSSVVKVRRLATGDIESSVVPSSQEAPNDGLELTSIEVKKVLNDESAVASPADVDAVYRDILKPDVAEIICAGDG